MRKKFSFIYPITRRSEASHRIGGHLYDHVTDLLVNGEAYITKANVLNNISNKYHFNIHEILFEGKNIYPNPEVFASLEDIKAACLNHVEQLLLIPEREAEQPLPRIYPALAKIITMPLKRKVK
jgi:hypothetical protein